MPLLWEDNLQDKEKQGEEAECKLGGDGQPVVVGGCLNEFG
jgi:hypothetical protein